ncbi:hypothetical protein Btru_071166 [Bulinus truncatus]|nr:hypothetical protein Btru_071166 [Bulinus truncatus]
MKQRRKGWWRGKFSTGTSMQDKCSYVVKANTILTSGAMRHDNTNTHSIKGLDKVHHDSNCNDDGRGVITATATVRHRRSKKVVPTAEDMQPHRMNRILNRCQQAELLWASSPEEDGFAVVDNMSMDDGNYQVTKLRGQGGNVANNQQQQQHDGQEVRSHKFDPRKTMWPATMRSHGEGDHLGPARAVDRRENQNLSFSAVYDDRAHHHHHPSPQELLYDGRQRPGADHHQDYLARESYISKDGSCQVPESVREDYFQSTHRIGSKEENQWIPTEDQSLESRQGTPWASASASRLPSVQDAHYFEGPHHEDHVHPLGGRPSKDVSAQATIPCIALCCCCRLAQLQKSGETCCLGLRLTPDQSCGHIHKPEHGLHHDAGPSDHHVRTHESAHSPLHERRYSDQHVAALSPLHERRGSEIMAAHHDGSHSPHYEHGHGDQQRKSHAVHHDGGHSPQYDHSHADQQRKSHAVHHNGGHSPQYDHSHADQQRKSHAVHHDGSHSPQYDHSHADQQRKSHAVHHDGSHSPQYDHSHADQQRKSHAVHNEGSHSPQYDHSHADQQRKSHAVHHDGSHSPQYDHSHADQQRKSHAVYHDTSHGGHHEASDSPHYESGHSPQYDHGHHEQHRKSHAVHPDPSHSPHYDQHAYDGQHRKSHSAHHNVDRAHPSYQGEKGRLSQRPSQQDGWRAHEQFLSHGYTVDPGPVECSTMCPEAPDDGCRVGNNGCCLPYLVTSCSLHNGPDQCNYTANSCSDQRDYAPGCPDAWQHDCEGPPPCPSGRPAVRDACNHCFDLEDGPRGRREAMRSRLLLEEQDKPDRTRIVIKPFAEPQVRASPAETDKPGPPKGFKVKSYMRHRRMSPRPEAKCFTPTPKCLTPTPKPFTAVLKPAQSTFQSSRGVNRLVSPKTARSQPFNMVRSRDTLAGSRDAQDGNWNQMTIKVSTRQKPAMPESQPKNATVIKVNTKRYPS